MNTLSTERLLENSLAAGSVGWCNGLGFALSLSGCTVQEGAKHIHRHMTNEGRRDDGVRKKAFKSFGLEELTNLFGSNEGALYVEAMTFFFFH